jgi:hypothetical protein
VKEAKRDVNYSRGHRDAHCGKMDAADDGYCTHFINRNQKDGACTEVEGTIGRGMWCELFKAAE